MPNASAAPRFTHLHVHSQYTLLGATPSVEALAAQAQADGMTHLALTDTQALYGAIAFARACRAVDIQPIIGMTVRVPAPAGTPNGSSVGRGIEPAGDPGLLVLLAANRTGYRALCRLASLVQGHPDRDARHAAGVRWEWLAEWREGLICVSGGRRCWSTRLLAAGDVRGAARYASRLAGLYGERAYLALELHDDADAALCRGVAELAQRFGMPTVAVQPVYCMMGEERARLRLLAAIAANCRLEQVPPAALPDGGQAQVDLHWLRPEQVAARFAAFPDAIAAVGQVTARCEAALPDGTPIWPGVDLGKASTPDGALAQLAEAGVAARYGEPSTTTLRRLHDELAAIARFAYAPLFLVVAEIVRYARSQEIPFSTRGSVANSLTAYVLGITTVDPIAHDLLFERFLNPERGDLPDIDLDFCSRRRDEVLSFVRARFGDEQVALVATISTLRPRSAMRETAKAYGLSEVETEQLARSVSDRWHPDPRRRVADTAETLAAKFADRRLQEVAVAAFGLVGTPDHLSVHPGGVVITPGATADFVPVQWAPKGFLITQYDHGDVETIGLPKIDLLGIRALTVLADSVALVRQQHPEFNLADLPLEDQATGELLAAADTIGVFQCESTGAQRTLRQLRAANVRDLAVANAFFKPGPAMGGMARVFVQRYRGEARPEYLHPALEPILAQTMGVLIFQEQVLRVAREVAGLSWGEADRLRRGISKFRGQELDALRTRFVEGCQRAEAGLNASQAATLWEQVEAFAGYGFNQGHATAYADVSYRSAYLKAHYPAEFLCARLADWGGFHHQAIYIAEAVRVGIRVRPPHVNHSAGSFSLEWECHQEAVPDTRPQPVLWMGLGQVRDLRRAALEAIIAARHDHPFRDLADLLARVALQRKEIEHLIQCGALDGLGESRNALLAEAQNVDGGSLQQMAFDFFAPGVPAESAGQRLAWEERILGQPVSVHPLDAVVDVGQSATLLEAQVARGKRVRVAGVRLPGWTGDKGWFLGDRRSFVVAVGGEDAPTPRPWKPLVAEGAWRRDEWGGGWLQVERWQALGDAV